MIQEHSFQTRGSSENLPGTILPSQELSLQYPMPEFSGLNRDHCHFLSNNAGLVGRAPDLDPQKQDIVLALLLGLES